MKERENARREAEERARLKALAPRIAEIKSKFVTKVLTEKVNDWERDRFEARVRNVLKSWEGVVLYVRGWSDFNHRFTAAKEEAEELQEIAGLKVAVDDLRNDPRIGWMLSSGRGALSYWGNGGRSIIGDLPKPSGIYTEKMERYLSKYMVEGRMTSGSRDYFTERHARRFVDAVDQLIRYDETIGKYLIRAAELTPTKRKAIEGNSGAIWMTTLAEIVVAVEKGEAIIFDENGTPLELGKSGPVGYLISLEVERPSLSHRVGKVYEDEFVHFDELFP